ncbi:MAG: hypothetical protein WAU75_02760, partial [Solirubrobacteraceae bacterium]
MAARSAGEAARSGAPRGQLTRATSRSPLLSTAPNSGSDSSTTTLTRADRSRVPASSAAKSWTRGGPWTSAWATQYGMENLA